MTIVARDFARGDEDRMTSANGTKRTCLGGLTMSALEGRTDVSYLGRDVSI
jgi:hypothetical protein